MRAMLKRSLVGALFFGIVGPLFGVAAFLVIGLIQTRQLSALEELWFLLPLGYLLGGLPAVSTGALVFALEPKLSRRSGFRRLSEAAIGFAVTACIWMTFSTKPAVVATMALIGGAAAAFAGWMYGRRSASAA